MLAKESVENSLSIPSGLVQVLIRSQLIPGVVSVSLCKLWIASLLMQMLTLYYWLTSVQEVVF